MFDRFTLRYSNATPILEMQQPAKGYPVLRVTYTNYPSYESRPGGASRPLQGGERWAIEVLLTPFEHREFIQNTILERALPLLRGWLTGPESPANNVRRMTKSCWYAIDSNLVKWIDDELTYA
jgi:hypothetical protein